MLSKLIIITNSPQISNKTHSEQYIEHFIYNKCEYFTGTTWFHIYFYLFSFRFGFRNSVSAQNLQSSWKIMYCVQQQYGWDSHSLQTGYRSRNHFTLDWFPRWGVSAICPLLSFPKFTMGSFSILPGYIYSFTHISTWWESNTMSICSFIHLE